MKTGLYFVAFLCGAAIGSAVTWIIARDKYSEIAQDEIDSVKEYYERKTPKDEVSEPKQNNVENSEKHIMSEKVARQLFRYGGGFKSERFSHPYIIVADEFGELEDYTRVTLTYFSNGYLLDEGGDIVDDIDEIIGNDILDQFAANDGDVIYVRNDERCCDYEIIYDCREYDDSGEYYDPMYDE